MPCGWLSDEQVGRKWKEHDDDACRTVRVDGRSCAAPGYKSNKKLRFSGPWVPVTLCAALRCVGALMDRSTAQIAVQIWRALPLTRFPTPKHASPYY